MATIPFLDIWEILKKILGDLLGRRNDPQYWWVNFKPQDGGSEIVAQVLSVRLEPKTGLKLVVDKAGTQVKLEARPTSLKGTSVYIDDVLDPDGRMVFAYKGSPGNPDRFAFDFKYVTLDGEEYRVDTRFDP